MPLVDYQPVAMTPGGPTLTSRAKCGVRGVMFWPRRLTAARRALPDFLILGAQKAGTTSLYDQLAKHPAVAPAFRKELHYFTQPDPPSESWYRAHFPIAAPGRLTGEATPYYLFHPAAPARVKVMLPDVKLIAMLRNPIDRAWSHYQFSIKLGSEQRSFDEAIEAELAFRADVEAGRRADHEPGDAPHIHHTYLARGLYAVQLQRWLAHFGHEQMRVIQSESYFAGDEAVWRDILAHLGLASAALDRPQWLKRGGYADGVSADWRGRLIEYFRPHNRTLWNLLGRRYDWDCA